MSSVRRRSRWRAWLAAYVFASIAWPAAAMLPLELIALDRTDATVASEHHHDGAGADHRHDASDLPGSPTHPDDHNCFECQVLQHLTRCVLPPVGPAIVPPLPPCFIAQAASSEAAHVSFLAPRPPIRGPPSIVR